MKTIQILSLALLFAATSATAQKVYTLTGPEAGRIFTYSATPNKLSTHYLKAISLILENRTASKIIVRVDHGVLFIAGDSSNQNFIVTREEMIALEPRQKRTMEIYAMCTELHDAVPSENDTYHAEICSDIGLRRLASLIGNKNYFRLYEAQQAVWAYCDRSPLEDISGYDTSAVRQLQQFVSDLTGLPVPPPPSAEDYRRNYYSNNLLARAGGSFEYEFNFTAAIRIGLFDKENRAVRELYFNAAEKPGKHNFEYEFDPSVYTDEVYYIRFILDDEILAEAEMDFRREPER